MTLSGQKTLQQKVRFYFEDIETPPGKAINLVITGLVVLSLAFFIAETYPLPGQVRWVLNRLNDLILIVFTIEYILRFWSAEHKLRHFFNLYSLIDLVVILPLIFTALDIRAIFARILFTIFTIIFVYSGLIYQVEHPINATKFATFLDAVYFSVATMTTVGYGDITPISQVGRLLAVLMILTGIALIPWQVGDLIKQLVKTANQVETLCSNCGWETHDRDAKHCKICGWSLTQVGPSCELPVDLSVDRFDNFPVNSSDNQTMKKLG
jgi:voltage-gated potassium channel